MDATSNNPIADLSASSTALNRKESITLPLNEKNTATEVSGELKKSFEPSVVKPNDEQDAAISSKQLEMVAQQLQSFVGEMNKGLEFLVDKDSGRDVIKVIDKKSGDLIKQYPSEEVLNLVSKLSDAAGALVNEKI